MRPCVVAAGGAGAAALLIAYLVDRRDRTGAGTTDETATSGSHQRVATRHGPNPGANSARADHEPITRPGPAGHNAIRKAGLPAACGAINQAFAGRREPDGTYPQDNVFQFLQSGP